MDADDRLADQLRRVLSRHDGPPGHVVEAARAALRWKASDAQLATLTFDSLDEPLSRVALRSGGASRMVAFATPDRAVEIEVDDRGDARHIVGQCSPGGTGTVEVRAPRSTRRIVVPMDHLGRFVAEQVPGGPVSVRCVPDRGDPVVTAWITV